MQFSQLRRREFITLLGGASLLLSVSAGAQQPTQVYRIAMLHPSHPVTELTETSSLAYYRAFFDELRRLGYVEGRNLLIERYSAEGHVENYPALARTVVSSNPDLIFTVGTPLARSLEEAASSIPIVVVTTDPVAEGVVQSLARPGGNITGATTSPGGEIWGKRLQLLREIMPTIKQVGILGYTIIGTIRSGSDDAAMLQAANRAGITIVGPTRLNSASDTEYRKTFAVIQNAGADALFVSPATEHITKRRLIVDLAAQFRLPAIYPFRSFVEAGGLIAYGPDIAESLRYCARSIDKILKGTKPGDIPYFLPTKFELVVNLGAAKTLGLTIPPSVLSLADELIE